MNVIARYNKYNFNSGSTLFCCLFKSPSSRNGVDYHCISTVYFLDIIFSYNIKKSFSVFLNSIL